MSKQNDHQNISDAIVLRANCCCDKKFWIRRDKTRKASEQSNKHSRSEKGFSISVMGEFDYFIDPIGNQIMVGRNVNTDKHKWHEYGMPGFIVTCNVCHVVTFHAYYHSRWNTIRSKSSFRDDVSLSWPSDLPVDQRSWLNLYRVGYYSWHHNSRNEVMCLGGAPEHLIDRWGSISGQFNDLSTTLMMQFWEHYFRDANGVQFERNFSWWVGSMANAYYAAMMKSDHSRMWQADRSKEESEKLRKLDCLTTEVAKRIMALKDGIKSRRLQDVRYIVEKVRADVGFKPVEYPEVKKPKQKKAVTA